MRGLRFVLPLFLLVAAAAGGAWACMQELGYNYKIRKLEEGEIGACHADVGAMEFHGRKAGTTVINRTLRDVAREGGCNDQLKSAEVKQSVAYVSPGFVSVRSERTIAPAAEDYGGCAISTRLFTFRMEDGKEYRLKDIVEVANLPEARKALAEDIAAREGWNEADLRRTIARIPDAELLESGLLMEQGRVLVNTGQYFLSCVEGDFHPGALPEALIRDKAMLEDFNKPRQKCH